MLNLNLSIVEFNNLKLKKMNQLIKTLAALFLIFNLIGCTKSPSEGEIVNLVNERYRDNLVLNIELLKKDKPKKINDKKLFSYVLAINYIQGGLSYGYVRGCPEKHCCKDTEYSVEVEYLIGKDKWDEWKIDDSRTIKRKETGTHWRPESIPLKEFYKDRISN